MNNLLNELLLIIFGYSTIADLINFRLVNKRWHKIINQRYDNQQIKISLDRTNGYSIIIVETINNQTQLIPVFGNEEYFDLIKKDSDCLFEFHKSAFSDFYQQFNILRFNNLSWIGLEYMNKSPGLIVLSYELYQIVDNKFYLEFYDLHAHHKYFHIINLAGNEIKIFQLIIRLYKSSCKYHREINKVDSYFYDLEI